LAFRKESVGVAFEELTGDGYAAGLAAALGRDVRFAHVPRETFASFRFPARRTSLRCSILTAASSSRVRRTSR